MFQPHSTSQTLAAMVHIQIELYNKISSFYLRLLALGLKAISLTQQKLNDLHREDLFKGNIAHLYISGPGFYIRRCSCRIT
jgi:hypothetical protein